MPMPSDTDFMQQALALARKANDRGEVPVGAVLVRGQIVIGEGANCSIHDHDPTAHAEIVALRDAAKRVGDYRLNDSTLYVTLEPCIMCASALVHARVSLVQFGAWDLKAGGAGSIVDIFAIPALNHRVDVFGGVRAEECGSLLSEFFRARRS